MIQTSIFFSILFFLLYLELSPKIGGIWLRRNSNNDFVICFKGLCNFIMYPFKNIQMWYPENWDINFCMFILISTSVLFIVLSFIKQLF